MKRTITALAFCCSLLLSLALFLFAPVEAKENTLLTLLNLPAPPPPNLFAVTSGVRDQKFYDRRNPPKDDAPIGDILDYWRTLSGSYQDLRYQPEMSATVRSRILKEIGRDHKLLPGLVDALKGDPRSADLIKEIYDRESASGVFDSEEKKSLKNWLIYNSPFFSNDLAGLASQAGDTDGYVTNHDELLALTNVDFEKARPIIDRLYNDSSLKTSRVLARWALYRRALATDSIGDIERYRDELKAIVEDKAALPGMRDLAMDALVGEKEWPGRDDWYFSLLEDETLADLRVNGTTYTGLTTLMLVSPPDKYIDKMLELVASSNVAVRTAAVKNLLLRLEDGGADVVKVFLPWLEDPKWATADEVSRQTIVQKLSEFAIPESVPGLIKIMDERKIVIVPKDRLGNAVNMAANAANAVNSNTTFYPEVFSVNANRGPDVPFDPKNGVEVITYPYRYTAAAALGKQKDPRAIPALRRILPFGENYQRGTIVGALLACGGFSVPEQMEALEMAAKGVQHESDVEIPESIVNVQQHLIDRYANTSAPARRFTADDVRFLLSQQLLQSTEISDDLARAIVARIAALDTSDPGLAQAYRRMILRWQNSVINLLLLNDVKLGKADSETILRLLSQRKDLREKQPGDVADVRNGSPSAVGIAACLLEDGNEYLAILDNGDADSRAALLSCARLLRLPLPVDKVAANFGSPNELLKLAAERYLESEDSPAARSIVLGRYPNQAKIMGATSAFFVEGSPGTVSEYIWLLYRSLGNGSLYNGWSGSGNDGELTAIGKRLQEEVKKEDSLLGVYAYQRQYIRIYKDRVLFSWDEDDSRYRERPLAKDEFDEIRNYLTVNNVDELPPFLSCGGEYCNARELLMLGRAGGRRVYMNGDPGEFFSGLDRYFDLLKQQNAALKYNLSREIPGLEILLASEALYAETVWSAPGDLRVAASDANVRKRIDSRIRELIIGESEGIEVEGDTPDAIESQDDIDALLKRRNTQGKAWYTVANGEAAGLAAQPPDAEYIPLIDALAVTSSPQRWKARAGEIELRSSNEGLFKVVRGKLTKIRSGDYEDPVVSANGRWAVAVKGLGEYDTNVVREDLLTNKEYPIEIEGYGRKYPVAYIPVLNRFLIVTSGIYGADEYITDTAAPAEIQPDSMVLLDPATGAMQPIAGEFRPLAQQTFRSLQPAAKPNEYWAAITDAQKNETVVGVFETRTFGFREVLTIPKIRFNSMNMWVDESAAKVYFVYRGHLLALPLPK